MAPLSPVIGAVAQLEERLHGMQEVVGSIPIGSTSLRGLFLWLQSLKTLKIGNAFPQRLRSVLRGQFLEQGNNHSLRFA